MALESAPKEQSARVAAGAESQARKPARRLLSGDGSWWWNGRRWVPAVTEDGLWRWDGARWRSNTDLEGKRPDELAAALTQLAEDGYARAGVILADRAEEWDAEGELRELAGRVQSAGRRLRELDQGLRESDSGRGGLLGRRASNVGDRHHREEERAAVGGEYRALAVELGRTAPQPSVKEADDVLVAARLLEERSLMLRQGLAEVEEAERMRADAAVSLQKELSSAEERRVRALQEASRAVRAAEADHARKVSEAKARLRAVLNPGPGELKGGLGLLRLHETLLDTPAGRLPAAGLAAHADTAAGLWREHRELLADLMLVEAPDTPAFLTALTDRSEALFLLVVARTGAVLWACPVGQEKAARHFAGLVTSHSRELASAREEAQAAARTAEKELETVIRDRSSVEAAEAEQERVESDPALLGAIEDVRKRLEAARADTPQLIEARRKVVELSRRLVAPPEQLRVAEPAPASR